MHVVGILVRRYLRYNITLFVQSDDQLLNPVAKQLRSACSTRLNFCLQHRLQNRSSVDTVTLCLASTPTCYRECFTTTRSSVLNTRTSGLNGDRVVAYNAGIFLLKRVVVEANLVTTQGESWVIMTYSPDTWLEKITSSFTNIMQLHCSSWLVASLANLAHTRHPMGPSHSLLTSHAPSSSHYD